MNLYNAHIVSNLLAHDLIVYGFFGPHRFGAGPSSIYEMYGNPPSNGYVDLIYEKGPRASELTLELANFYLGLYTKEYTISKILDFVFQEGDIREPYFRLVLNHTKKDKMPEGFGEVSNEEMTSLWRESWSINGKIQTPTSITPLTNGSIKLDTLIDTLQKIKEELPESDKTTIKLDIKSARESGGIDICHRLVVLPKGEPVVKLPTDEKKNKGKNKEKIDSQVEQKQEPPIVVIQGVTGYLSIQQY